jgi:translation elongation factor EF-Ts
MSNPISENDLKEVVNAILAGQKIEAIKLYREYSGLGLKDAKDAVEEIEKKLRTDAPEKFRSDQIAEGRQQGTKRSGVEAGKGCFGVLAVIVVGIMVLLSAIVIIKR